jgi:GntR family transcriptional repressor for pyruvate dehydrogenase complex
MPNKTAERRIQTLSVSEAVVQQLLEDISTGAFRPGDRLPPQRELARQLGVSNSSIREGLQSLQAMGVIETRHGVGTFVVGDARLIPILKNLTQEPSPEQYAHVLEIRCLIEPRLAWLAALRITDEQLDEMSRALSEMAKGLEQENAKLYFENDMRFHTLLFAATGNSLFWALLQPLSPAFLAFFEAIPYSSAGLIRHHALLDALRQHDSSLAASTTTAILAHSLLISRDSNLISTETYEHLSRLLTC